MKKNICITVLSFTMIGQLNAQYLMYNKDSVMTPSNNLSSNNQDSRLKNVSDLPEQTKEKKYNI